MTSLGIDRLIDSTPDRIWSALTEPSQVEVWWWPHLDNTAEIDLRVGGSYRFVGPKAGIAVSGHYLEVAPPQRLAFTWRWDGGDRISQAAFELHAEPEGGTLLTVVQIGLVDRAERDNHIQGWTDCLDRLGLFVR